jgi:hypothetical protein
MIWPRPTKQQKEAIKKFALEHPPSGFGGNPESSARRKGLPIRTPLAKDLEPSRPTPEMGGGLRKLAREMMELANHQPSYLTAAIITKRTFPVVPGKLQLRGVYTDRDRCPIEHEIILDDMLWDAGSHGCTIETYQDLR